MRAYLLAVTLTVAVEVPLWTLATAGRTRLDRALIGLGANLLTHGTLWSVWVFVPLSYTGKLVLLEALVWLVEATICAGFGLQSWSRALGLTLVLNLLTIAIGLAMRS